MPERFDPIAAEQEMAELFVHVDAAVHRLLTLIRAYEASGAWAGNRIRSFPHWLSWRYRLKPSAAREWARVARKLGELPRIDAALKEARISYSKARALVRVADDKNEAALVEMAENATAAQLEKICAGVKLLEPHPQAPPERYVRSNPTRDGMVRLTAQLYPHEAALVMRAIEAARASLAAAPSPPADSAESPRPESETEPAAETETATEPEPATETDVEVTLDDAAESFLYQEEELPEEARSLPFDLRPEYLAETARLFSAMEESLRPVRPAPAALPSATADSALAAAAAPLLRELERRWAREDGVATATGSFPSRADALLYLSEVFLGRGRPRTGGARYELFVHLTPDLLDGRMKAQLGDGSLLSTETLRKIACDTSLVGILQDGSGRLVDAGRRTRQIKPATRRALELRDHHCCRFPGCQNHKWLEAHHVISWLDGGPTNLDNLALLCFSHHQLLHEGAFTMRARGGEIVFLDRTGRVIDNSPAPAPLQGDPVRFLNDSARATGVTPDPAQTLPPFQWSRPDYPACIAAARS